MNQIKKNPNDPDAQDLNPEIIKLGHRLGFVNQPIQLYLHGELTWMETLESIILLLAKEYKAQNTLLVQALSEKPSMAIMLSGASGSLIKGMPKRPLIQDRKSELNPEELADIYG